MLMFKKLCGFFAAFLAGICKKHAKVGGAIFRQNVPWQKVGVAKSRSIFSHAKSGCGKKWAWLKEGVAERRRG
jgi:hypothetical protein